MATSIVTYPLATVAPTVSAAGISSPSLNDILQSFKAQVMAIYGSDLYLESDSKDGQMLAIFAQAQFDSNMVAIATWNAYNPQTAVGNALDAAVKVNGIRRHTPTNSTVTLTLGGEAGTTIFGGIAADINGNLWDLPANVVIPLSGEIDVTATAENPGNITAQPHTITTRFTQVLGWQSVTNNDSALAGNAVETDGQLRQRQSTSTSITSRTTAASIRAAVGNLPGVTRVEVYTNDTGAPDVNGIPGHSFSVVVEGGDVQQIGQTIANTKDVGSGTFGSTTVTATDPNGNPININFMELHRVPIYYHLVIRQRSGFQDITVPLIGQALVNFVNSLGVGEPVYNVWSVSAASNQIDQSYVLTSLVQGRDQGNLSAADIPIAFNEAAWIDPTSDPDTGTPNWHNYITIDAAV